MIEFRREMFPIGPAIRSSPEYQLVGDKSEGWFGKRQTWIHIKDGGLVGIVELSINRILGDMGSASGPAYFSGVKQAYQHFSELGVSDDVFKREIEPRLRLIGHSAGSQAAEQKPLDKEYNNTSKMLYS